MSECCCKGDNSIKHTCYSIFQRSETMGISLHSNQLQHLDYCHSFPCSPHISDGPLLSIWLWVNHVILGGFSFLIGKNDVDQIRYSFSDNICSSKTLLLFCFLKKKNSFYHMTIILDTKNKLIVFHVCLRFFWTANNTLWAIIPISTSLNF